jgi:hypothetical protein
MPTPLVPDSRASHNGGNPLPLFRQEALLYQQQKFYGDIILIRPLSLTLLTWLAIAIVALAVGLLGFGHYTEKLRLPVSPSSDSGADNQVELHVPGRWLSLVQPGAHVAIRCRNCSSPTAETGTVSAIANAPLTASGPESSEPTYKVTVSLPPLAAQTLELNRPSQAGTNVEAEIPLGRKPLIQWFFARPAS